MYRSEIIQRKSSDYIRLRTLYWLGRVGWLLAAMLIATAVAACFDTRFLYVLLIEIFIIYPMAFGPVWLSEAASPFSRREILAHRLLVSPTGISIEYLRPNDVTSPKDEIFVWSDFSAYHDAGKSVILKWNSKGAHQLQIPENAYNSDDWQAVASILAQNLPSC